MSVRRRTVEDVMRDCNNTFTVETHPRRRHRNKSDGRRPWIEKDGNTCLKFAGLKF